MNRISPTQLIKLVTIDNADKKQHEGFACVGFGIHLMFYGVEVPFSLIELLGVKYSDLWSESDGEMIQGFYGACPQTLFYITVDKYNTLINSYHDEEMAEFQQAQSSRDW